ncbi:MAG: hypothetical protein MUF37_02590 [Methanoregulaceae archaeon]|jgi:uncharacterized protein with PhoU and TrkA domain|nr:hypothetical protein [Methanoregulaceae archaeon]
MDEIQLIAQKRAFPSRGRARIHSDLLSDLGIEEGATIEIGVPDADKWISATAFADSLVESGHIRLSEEDLKVLGAGEGSKLRIRKKASMTEQIKGGVSKTGETIKGTSAESIKAGASGAASSVSSGLGKAGHSVSAAFSNAYEAAKKKLKPTDAATLDKALKANKGEVRAVTIPTGSGTRQLSGIKLPAGVVLAAVQRGDAIQTTDPSFVLVGGDIVYLVGETSLLDEATKVIGG